MNRKRIVYATRKRHNLMAKIIGVWVLLLAIVVLIGLAIELVR